MRLLEKGCSRGDGTHVCEQDGLQERVASWDIFSLKTYKFFATHQLLAIAQSDLQFLAAMVFLTHCSSLSKP